MSTRTETDPAELISRFGDDVYLDEHQFSLVTNIPVPTLRTWRSREAGPPYAKIGRSVRYHWGTAKAYFKGCTVGRAA